MSNGTIVSTGSIRGSSIAVTNGAANQFLKADGSLDSSTYLTGNQTITLSGDVSGSGTTSISVSIGSGKVTNAMLAGSIANSKLSNSSITINGSSTSLGGSFSTASITAGTAGQSGASTGVSFSIPYVTMNAYGIVTAYGTHTHTISASDLTTTIGSTTYAAYHSAGYVKKDGDTMTGALTPASTQVGVPWAAQYYTYSSLNTPDTQVAGFSFYHGTGTNYASGYPYGYANIISFGESSNALQFAWTRGVVGYSNLSVRSYENSVYGVIGRRYGTPAMRVLDMLGSVRL